MLIFPKAACKRFAGGFPFCVETDKFPIVSETQLRLHFPCAHGKILVKWYENRQKTAGKMRMR